MIMWSSHNDFSQIAEYGPRNRRLATIILLAVLASFETVLVSALNIIRASYGVTWDFAKQAVPLWPPSLIVGLTALSLLAVLTALASGKEANRRIGMTAHVVLSFASTAVMMVFWNSRTESDASDAVWSALLPAVIFLGGSQATLGAAMLPAILKRRTWNNSDVINVALLAGFLLVSGAFLFGILLI